MHKSTAHSVNAGALRPLADSFMRNLCARNASPKTIEVYSLSIRQLADFLDHAGLPSDVREIDRGHISDWMNKIMEEWTAATASTKYRAVQSFFRYLVEEGEIEVSPLLHMSPPRVPVRPVPVISEHDLKALLAVCRGNDFDSRRDSAIIRMFLDTGARKSEISGIRYTPDDWEMNDVDIDGGTVSVWGKGKRQRIQGIGHRRSRHSIAIFASGGCTPGHESPGSGLHRKAVSPTREFARCWRDAAERLGSKISILTGSGTRSLTAGWRWVATRAT